MFCSRLSSIRVNIWKYDILKFRQLSINEGIFLDIINILSCSIFLFEKIEKSQGYSDAQIFLIQQLFRPLCRFFQKLHFKFHNSQTNISCMYSEKVITKFTFELEKDQIFLIKTPPDVLTCMNSVYTINHVSDFKISIYIKIDSL